MAMAEILPFGHFYSDPQDRSTDPDFPKETFPPASRCRSCFLANGSWHLPAVAEFLNVGCIWKGESMPDH